MVIKIRLMLKGMPTALRRFGLALQQASESRRNATGFACLSDKSSMAIAAKLEAANTLVMTEFPRQTKKPTIDHDLKSPRPITELQSEHSGVAARAAS